MAKKLPPLTRHAITAPTEDQGTRLAGARLLPIQLVQPNPWQPRQHANPERMQELLEDIAARGILEPIIVRPIDEGKYEVVAGERRYRAAIAAGLGSIPAIIKEDMTEEDAREVSLVENLLREDLDIEDEARFLKALYEQKKSLRAVGEAIHKSYQYVNRRLKLLEDPQALLAYREGLINLDHLILGRTPDPVDFVMEEASSVTERNNVEAESLESEVVTEGDGDASSLRGGSVTERNNVEEVRFFRTRSAFKPFHKLQLHVRRLETVTIAAEERPKLRQTVRDLIADLSRLEQALEEENEGATSEPQAELDIELEERADGQPGWAVRRIEPQ
jgi:ParB/RepB/Spo0J family partition protein